MEARDFVSRSETELLAAVPSEFPQIRNRIMRDASSIFDHSCAREINDALPDTYEQAKGLLAKTATA